MNALLTAIVLWLSTNLGLPAIYDHPRVEFVPTGKILALRYGAVLGSQPGMGAGSSQSGQREVVAVYDSATKTIYLREGWTGGTPAELSVLVHEMVHHLQNAGNLKFECPQEREQSAYAAQERWLGLFGHDLLHDFEIDPFTLLVSTKCLN
jgi:Domain of unknown function (DUF6647)